jgi:hypothetical protein
MDSNRRGISAAASVLIMKFLGARVPAEAQLVVRLAAAETHGRGAPTPANVRRFCARIGSPCLRQMRARRVNSSTTTSSGALAFEDVDTDGDGVITRQVCLYDALMMRRARH